jgi:hypothetical protein
MASICASSSSGLIILLIQVKNFSFVNQTRNGSRSRFALLPGEALIQ